jgi:hypothetical protein
MRAVLRAITVLAVLALALSLACGPARAVPRVIRVHVTEGGVVASGALVNITDVRTGWKMNGTTDAGGLYYVSAPFEDPGGDIVGGDLIIVTATREGHVGAVQFTIQEQDDPYNDINVALVANLLPTAVTLTLVESGSSHAELSWTQSDVLDFGKYAVFVSTDESSVGTERWSSSSPTSTACRIDGLASSTTYYFSVAVVDAGGARAMSNVVSARTSGVSPGAAVYAIVTLMVVIIAALAAWLYWRRPKSLEGPEKIKRRRRGQ